MENKTTVTVIAEPTPTEERIRNAAAYVRVSTESEKQLHSFAYQYSYWKGKLSNDSKFNMVGVYADEGISGKSLQKRKAFNEMVVHAKEGKIDIIFVKSVSRFGRSFMDVLKTVRELRDHYGVIVYFEEEEMYSDDPLADTMLSMRAMVAEQELKDMSEQQKWAIRRKFRNGILNNNGRFYGFMLTDDENGIKQLTPIPHEADVIRLIYNLYLENDYGIEPLAKELTGRGIPTPGGKSYWDKNSIMRILTNEKYTGDALLQRYYTEDYVQKLNIGDNPDAPMIYVENNHEGIVDKETFRKVQEKLASRRNPKMVGRKQEACDFKGLVRCGVCGANFRHKVYQYRGKGLYGFMACGNYLSNRTDKCQSHSIKDSILEEIFLSAFNEFVVTERDSDSIRELESELKTLRLRDNDLYGLFHRNFITQIGYITEHNTILQEIAVLEKQLAAKSEDNIYKVYKKKMTEFDGAMVRRFLKEAIVQEWTVAFVFKNGVTITREYTNGTAGNKVGWAQNANARKFIMEDKNNDRTNNGKKDNRYSG